MAPGSQRLNTLKDGGRGRGGEVRGPTDPHMRELGSRSQRRADASQSRRLPKGVRDQRRADAETLSRMGRWLFRCTVGALILFGALTIVDGLGWI